MHQNTIHFDFVQSKTFFKRKLDQVFLVFEWMAAIGSSQLWNDHKVCERWLWTDGEKSICNSYLHSILQKANGNKLLLTLNFKA